LAALGAPLLLNRLWSGCHFCPLAAVERALLAVPLRLPSRLTFRLLSRLTFLSMSISTSP
jgi:hypothetical protein